VACTIVPTEHNGKYVICVVQHGDALDRIRDHDPAIVPGEMVLKTLRLGGTPPAILLKDVDFMFAYEESAEEFHAKCAELGSSRAIMKYLGRNWENRPEDTAVLTKVGSVEP
jgi:hypothetical protein